MTNWFEVDKDGLAKLQGGKPKVYILRELIQNAWDENIKECEVLLQLESNGRIRVTVIDDSPEGFRDLADSFTLFKETYKRDDPKKRGRFNLGEKQAIARCDWAYIATTKGTVIFDKNGRHTKRTTRTKGSLVEVIFDGTKQEFDEILTTVKNYLPPKGIKFLVNGETIPSREPLKVITANLTTENNENGVFKRTARNTEVHIHKPDETAYLYEMGIPVTPIECKYGIDVQQKIPLGVDRESVPESYLKDVYAEVLNAMADDLKEEDVSGTWVRLGSEDERVQESALRQVIKTRYGTKVVVANPFDKVSIDDAISHGYKVVHGSEMSKDEWGRVREFKLISSSSEVFGHSFASAVRYEPDGNMIKVAELSKRVAKRFMSTTITVQFIKSSATIAASYGPDTKVLTDRKSVV